MRRCVVEHSKKDPKSFIVTDDYFIELLTALTNLSPYWTKQLKQGSIKLQWAVQIGSRLDQEQQRRYMEWLQDTLVPDKWMGKVLHAFSMNMPEWAVHHVLRIYKLAEKTRAAIIMYNDLMALYEEIILNFEYEFLEGGWPEEDELLEQILHGVEKELQSLADQAGAHHKKDYRDYGDSSTDSYDRLASLQGCPYPVLIGLKPDAGAEQIRAQSRRLLKKLHPDHGGSACLFDLVKKAYDTYSQQ